MTTPLQAIEEYLARIFAGGTQNEIMIRTHLASGGKRLRALIPIRLYQAYHRDWVEILPLSGALEIIHNATLVHDDLQDEDQTRRGQPTIWRTYGQAQAINCGDALFQWAIASLENWTIAPPLWQKIVLGLSRATLRVIEGQAQEFLMKSEVKPHLDRYFEIIQGKTAALFAAAFTTSGWALGGISPEDTSLMENQAQDLGVLFQLQDDLLDLYGEKQREHVACDIFEGKISALVAALNECADSQTKDRMRQILQLPREQTTAAHVDEALRAFEKSGALARVKGLIRNLQGKLITSSTQTSLRAPWQQVIIEMTGEIMQPIAHLF